MKKQILLLIICLTGCFTGFSQIKFEPGYIIDDSGLKKNVLIQNKDWTNNPSVITYKNSETSEELTATISQINEFGVGTHVFEKATVQVDQSSEVTSKLSQDRNPEFAEETILLKKLVDGPASLYVYNRKGYKYFYKVGDAPISQLIYKRYLTSGKIAHNYDFRQQLWTDLACEDMDLNKLQKLNYNSGDLTPYFYAYNSCQDSSFKPAIRERGTPEVNLNIKGGIDVATLSVDRGLNAKGLEMNGIGYRLGLELEYILPFNKNKWGVHLEPNYRSFRSQVQVTEAFTADLDVNYTSIEIGVGGKYYMFLNSKSKLFITASYLTDFPVNSRILFENTRRNIDPELTTIHSKANIVLGAGYKYGKKYILELKYGLPRQVYGTNYVAENFLLDWKSDYSYLSLMVGYTLF